MLVFVLPINQGRALSTYTVNSFKETGIRNSWELNCSEKNGEDSLSLHMQVKGDVTWCGLLYFSWGMCVCVCGGGGWVGGGHVTRGPSKFSPFFPPACQMWQIAAFERLIIPIYPWMTNYTHLPLGTNISQTFFFLLFIITGLPTRVML